MVIDPQSFDLHVFVDRFGNYCATTRTGPNTRSHPVVLKDEEVAMLGTVAVCAAMEGPRAPLVVSDKP